MAQQIDVASNDLNTVISTAVQARIETEVAAALSGSELMSQYVQAALHQPIEVQDRNYRKRNTTYLRETIDEAMREATKAAVKRVIVEEQDKIEAEVARELRKNVKGIANQLATNMADAAGTAYGMKIEVTYPGAKGNRDNEF